MHLVHIVGPHIASLVLRTRYIGPYGIRCVEKDVRFETTITYLGGVLNQENVLAMQHHERGCVLDDLGLLPSLLLFVFWRWLVRTCEGE